MKSIFLALFLLGLRSASAEIGPPTVSNSLFSLESLPGGGNLNFTFGQQEENLEFGKDKGFYSIALVFGRKNLPQNVAKSLPKHQIIQIALGSRNTTQSDKLAQFGAITLKVSQVPRTEALTLKCQDVSKADKSQKDSAFILFNSSQTKFSAEDQDKLKTTVFSESGQVKMSPVGTSENVVVKHGGKNFPFKRQLMSLAIDTTLSTPFSSEKGSLKGTVQVPLFSPSNSASNRLVAELAQESLEKDPEIAPPEKAPRTLASPEEPRPKKR